MAETLLQDHSRDLETLLRIRLDQLSTPLPTSILDDITTACSKTQHRLVISLNVHHPPTTTEDSFQHFQHLLSQLYGKAEKVKAQSDNILLVVDVVLNGFSRSLEPDDEWQRVFDMTDKQSERSSGSVDWGEMKRVGEGKRLPLVVAMGGTFDRLHGGHKILLSSAAFLAQQQLIVGITDDALLERKQFRHLLQSLQERTQSVSQFLNFFAPHLLFHFPPLRDVFGPTILKLDIDAIVVSKETISGATKINEERMEKNWHALDQYSVEVLGMKGGGDETEKMGSTAIRSWIAKQTIK